MSMTSSKNGNAGPACEKESLIIEVMGKAHADPYTFRIFDASNQKQQEWLESQAIVESLDVQKLHLWPWEGQETKNVWLDIATDDGSPVRVALFDEVTASPRQMDAQWNRVWPVVPLTILQDPNPEPGSSALHPAPVRPGFVYVFRKGRLWRELEVAVSESGALSFRDVRLLDYRNSLAKPINEDRRPPVGQSLEAIWIPVSRMNRSAMGDFQFAFSEVQLSARRLNYLEADEAARQERCQTVRGPEPSAAMGNVSEQQMKMGGLVALDALPAMRLRESELEQRLPRPWKQIYDLAGKYACNLFGHAKEEMDAFKAGGESAENAWETACYSDAPLRGAPAARADAHLAQSGASGANTALWEALDPTLDVFETVKANGYAGIFLEDRLFSLRHRVTQALEAHRHLTSLLEAVSQQPHSNSAQLVYRLMGPQRLNGKENPLHSYLDEIDSGRFGPLHAALFTAQRQLAREELAEAQKQLAALIRQPENQRALADLFSLSEGDYIEGFALTNDLFQVLVLAPDRIDHLARTATVSDAQVKDANDLVLKIVEEGSDQPLHHMLFPPEQPTGADGATPESLVSVECGDGRCRPTDLEKLPEQSPESDSVQTLTAATLVAVAKTDALELPSEARRWMAGVGAILDGLDKQVRSLANRLKSQSYRLDSRIYGPLLRMAKARDKALLGTVQLVARNAVPQGWVILGLRDPASGLDMGLTEADRAYAHKANGHRQFYGEYLDADGNPLASTRKANIPDLADTAEARNVSVYAAPEDAEIVKAQRDMRRLKSWDEFFARVRVPYLVLVLEGHNIMREASLTSKTRTEKGRLRAGAGVFSAAFDLLFAATIAAERLSLDLKIWGGISEKLGSKAFETSNPVFTRAFPSLARAVPEVITKRMAGGLITAGLSIAVSLLDMAHEWDTGDGDSAAAYGVSAVGGGMMVMGGLMMAKMTEVGIAPVLMGLGPWGWVLAGATIAIGAGVIASILDDPPLVDWMKRGPFGPEQDDAYPHLANNPEETYYRLVDLLTKPRIRIEPIHDVPAKLAAEGLKISPRQNSEFAKINMVVKVENSLATMLDSANLTVAMRSVTTIRKPTRRGTRTHRERSDESPNVMIEQPLSTGRAYYLALPPRETFKTIWGYEGTKTSQVLVRAQWQGGADFDEVCRNFVFPAPELHDSLTFDAVRHGVPKFAEEKVVFWADEQTHKPEETK